MRTSVARLYARNFRNLASVELVPSLGGLTVVRGPNGAGKTSLLEALAYCSVLQSFRGVPKDAVVRSGQVAASIGCELRLGARRVDIGVEIEPGRRDRAVLNGQRVAASRELLDVLRTTLFTPDDLDLVKGAPAARRDLLDAAVASTRPRLGAERANFERALRHRNALLRQVGGRLSADEAITLDVWDERLSESGERVVSGREELVAGMGPLAREAFASLSPAAGPLNLSYERSFEGPLSEALHAARQEDVRRQMTTVGPQRDELALSAGGLDARTRLSQGRQRCVALALRLATHRYVTAAAAAMPVLLLDDAFSELDEATARSLVNELPSGQALLTTAGGLPPGAEPDLIVQLSDGVLS